MTIGVAGRAMTKARQVWRKAFTEAELLSAPDKVFVYATKAVMDQLGVHISAQIAGRDIVVRVSVDGVELYVERGPLMARNTITERALARVKARDLKRAPGGEACPST